MSEENNSNYYNNIDSENVTESLPAHGVLAKDNSKDESAKAKVLADSEAQLGQINEHNGFSQKLQSLKSEADIQSKDNYVSDEINFEEFQEIFNEFHSDKSNLKNVFLEGFALLDRNK